MKNFGRLFISWLLFCMHGKSLFAQPNWNYKGILILAESYSLPTANLNTSRVCDCMLLLLPTESIKSNFTVNYGPSISIYYKKRLGLSQSID